MRMLQVPERQRAMGLDSKYKMNFAMRRDKIGLLGNGVCPPVMKAIAKNLTQTALFRIRSRSRGIRTLGAVSPA